MDPRRAADVDRRERKSPRPPFAEWLDALCAFLAFAIPLGVTLFRASITSQWRDDLALVRGLGLVPVGTEGVLSGALMQFMALLPLGGRVLRAALVSAIALGFASRLLYALSRRLMRTAPHTATLVPPLALAAALITSLSVPWQLEGTVAGGITLAVALALGCLLVREPSAPSTPKVWLLEGMLLGAVALEHHLILLLLVLALGVRGLSQGRLPRVRQLVVMSGAATFVFGIGLLPLLLRSLSGRAWLDLGQDPSSAALLLHLMGERGMAAARLFQELGIVELALAGLGALAGLLTPRRRAMCLPLLAWACLLLLLPDSRGGAHVSDGQNALAVLGVASTAALASMGAVTLLSFLRQTRLPFARPAAALFVAFTYTLVFMTHEDSARVANRGEQVGAEVWTDEVFGQLPPNSLLLMRSEPLAWHLWAARVVRADRPDLVVVPLSMLEEGSLAARLLDSEPALLPLLREMRVAGRPTEYALSALADARPLFVEFDPKWDRRLTAHLLPGTFWMRFAPHPLGNSDREGAIAEGRGSFERVLASARQPAYEDTRTLAVLGAQATEQALLLASIGDRTGLSRILENLRSLESADTLVETLEARAKETPRGSLQIADLLN